MKGTLPPTAARWKEESMASYAGGYGEKVAFSKKPCCANETACTRKVRPCTPLVQGNKLPRPPSIPCQKYLLPGLAGASGPCGVGKRPRPVVECATFCIRIRPAALHQ